MSDYMFMLESHLSTGQNKVVSEVRGAAEAARVNLFLTGGAIRDMLGGFPIRDLDFTVEGDALKLAKAVAAAGGARVIARDEERQSVELLFPGDITAQIAMAREEKYSKSGAKPQVSPATIYVDLKGRDFTINSIALSLNRASLGLLIDPNNGVADLDRKELRAVHNYIFYDDPGRILRLIRFQARLGFTVEQRTRQQYENVRLEGLERKIPARRLFEELRQIAHEPNCGEALRLLEEEKLLELFGPMLAGPKLNLAGFAKLQKARQLIPFGVDFQWDELALFLCLLMEKLTPKERMALARNTAMRKSEFESWQKLEARCRKTEKQLKSPKLRKASQIYWAYSKVPGEEILLLLLRSGQRIVHDRIRNYLQKYLPAAQEITDRQVTAATGVEPGAPKFKALREQMITARLDGRLRKPGEQETASPEVPAAAQSPSPGRKRKYENHQSPKLSLQRKPRAAASRR